METYAMVSPKNYLKKSNNIETVDALNNGVGVFLLLLFYIFSYEII